MSVAENPVAERTPRSPQQRLALGSLCGALYVLASLWIIFAGLPTLWAEMLSTGPGQEPVVNPFLADALLLVVDLGVAFGLGWLGYRLISTQTERGLRAGIFCAAVEIFLVLWIGFWVGRMLQEAEFGASLGWTVTAVVMAVLAAGFFYVFALSPGWYDFLVGFEEQGWFTLTPYKGNQGVRTRRATVLGALVLGFSGIITMVNHRSFGSERLGANDWYWTVPFTTRTVKADVLFEKAKEGTALNEDERKVLRDLAKVDQPNNEQLEALAAEQAGHVYTYSLTFPLMYKLHLVLPVVFALVLFWFAYRLVNVPTFADFLIATEAEMNKVSWTTRRRLFQDTIVVLVTVLLMTIFLFVIDIVWIKALGFVGVLQVDVKAQLQKQQEKSQW